ncbi:MAG: nucleotidyltransferase domain-containing protein [Ferruginibacter sp.]
MNIFGISEKSFNLILQTLQECDDVQEAFIFGSRAKGNYNAGSDVDLAIKTFRPDISIAMKLSAILNERLPIPYKVDVIDYTTLTHQELKNHIDRVGKILFSRQEKTTNVHN